MFFDSYKFPVVDLHKEQTSEVVDTVFKATDIKNKKILDPNKTMNDIKLKTKKNDRSSNYSPNTMNHIIFERKIII